MADKQLEYYKSSIYPSFDINFERAKEIINIISESFFIEENETEIPSIVNVYNRIKEKLNSENEKICAALVLGEALGDEIKRTYYIAHYEQSLRKLN